MEHNTDRILWTVLILAIGVALYVGFRPAANDLLHQGVDKIQDVVTNVNSNPSDSSSANSSSSSSSSSTNTNVGSNLLTETSSYFRTAPTNIYNFSSDELKMLENNPVTVRAFIHNPTTHTVNLVIWTDGYGLAFGSKGFGVGNGVPAGTDGYSTITGYRAASSITQGNIDLVDYTNNAEVSGVQYKELKMEKGSVATPWVP